MSTIPTPPTPERTSARRHSSLMGPVILITLGVMFLLAQFLPSLEIHKTWPAILIVIGVIKLLNAGRPPRPPEGPRI